MLADLAAFAAEVFERLAIRRLDIGCRWPLIVGTSGREVFPTAQEIEAAQIVAAQLPAARAEIAAVVSVKNCQNGQASTAGVTGMNAVNIKIENPRPTDDDTVVATIGEYGRCLRNNEGRDFGVVAFCILSHGAAGIAGKACGEDRQYGEQKMCASFIHLGPVSGRSMGLSSGGRSLCKHEETS